MSTRHPFGWDYPAGVTDAMIDEYFGSDEEIEHEAARSEREQERAIANYDGDEALADARSDDEPSEAQLFERAKFAGDWGTTYAVVAWYLDEPHASPRLSNRPCILFTSPREHEAERISQRLRRAARVTNSQHPVMYFVNRFTVPSTSEQCHTPEPSGWVQTYPEHSPEWCSDSPTCTCPRCRPHYDAGDYDASTDRGTPWHLYKAFGGHL